MNATSANIAATVFMDSGQPLLGFRHDMDC